MVNCYISYLVGLVAVFFSPPIIFLLFADMHFYLKIYWNFKWFYLQFMMITLWWWWWWWYALLCCAVQWPWSWWTRAWPCGSRRPESPRAPPAHRTALLMVLCLMAVIRKGKYCLKMGSNLNSDYSRLNEPFTFSTRAPLKLLCDTMKYQIISRAFYGCEYKQLI